MTSLGMWRVVDGLAVTDIQGKARRATLSGPVRIRSPVRTNSPGFRLELPLSPSTSRSTVPAA